MAPLQVLTQLKVLYLQKNQVDDVDSVIELVRALPQLRELDLSLNPLCSTPKYFERIVIFTSRNLELLNKKCIDAKQRLMMQTHAAHKHRYVGVA